MLKLCGFPISNYYNKVRIALIEKGIPHEEDSSCKPSQKDEFLARTPVGKVPFLELDGGRRLSESQVICEYLEDAYPQKPLMPRDPYERARTREPGRRALLRRRSHRCPSAKRPGIGIRESSRIRRQNNSRKLACRSPQCPPC